MLRKVLFVYSFMLIISTSAEGLLSDWKELKKDYGLNLQAIYYFDDRDFNTLSVYTAAYKLPYGFSFWGFTDFHGNQNPPRDRARLTRSFSEYRLTYSLEELTGIKGLGIQAEYNYFSNNDYHNLRIGPVYKHPIPFLPDGSWFLWRFFPEETSDDMQISWAWKFVITEKWSITGFADHNIHEGRRDRWVFEPQLNYKLNDYVSLHLEYRYNGYEDANDNLRGNGVAIGIGVTF